MSGLSIRLFGAPQIQLDGLPVETDRRKAVALLAVLAVDPPGRSRESLAALFWPEFDSTRAFAYLRRSLWELNQALGEGWVQTERDLVRLDPAARTWVDVSQFERLLEGRAGPADERARLEEAVALYRGDFMASFSLRDSPDFDAWQMDQSERLRLRFASALQALSRQWAASGEFEPAIAQARRALALDPLQEAAQRWLMELYARAGQRNAALRQYEACTRLLEDELGVAPETETQDLAQGIRQGQFAAPTPGETPRRDTSTPTSTAASSSPPHPAAPLPQLPRPATAFVGREKELAEIARLLADPDCRLLSLIGPGGIGKTRLALQAAQSAAPAFSDEACFVPLASLTSPDQMVPAIAAALQFYFQDKVEKDPCCEPLEQLTDYLRQRQILLVLDNFEHLVAGAGLLSALLSAAPGLKLLATSRERLNLAEEWALGVGGMEFPSLQAAAAEGPEEYAAVRLFLQAARQSQVGFTPGPADLAAIRRICQLVDGMPLGIEMAAAWVRMLSCAEIAAEIERSFDFLESARAGVPERHRNLRAAFEHSWTLLSEPERAAFQALSIFHGGFTRQAAAQVTGASLGMLSSLVDKSLVHRSPEGRYDLHEVLKRFAAEKLDAAPRQKGELLEAQRQFYLALLLDAAEQMEGAGQKAALAQVQQETENVRSAWLLTAQQGSLPELEEGLIAISKLHEVGQRHREALSLVRPLLNRLRAEQAAGKSSPALTNALGLTLVLLSLYYLTQEEGPSARPFYAEFRSLLPALPPGRARTYALLLSNFGSAFNGDRQAVRPVFEACADFFRANHDPWGLCMTLLTYGGMFEFEQGYNSEMNDFTRQALEVALQSGNRWGMAICYHQLTTINYWLAEYEPALAYGRQAHEIYLDLNDRWRAMEVQIQLGRIETDRSRYAEARRYFQDNIAFARELGSRYFTALNQDCLGYVELLDGNLDEAGRFYQSSLELYRALNSHNGEGMSLGNLGDVALARRDYERARACYSQSLEVLKLTQDTWGRSIQVKKLGLVALESGQYTEAAHQLEQALALSLEVNRLPDIQEVRFLQARLKLQTGETAAARALLNEVLAHPATTQPIRAQAAALSSSISSEHKL